LVNNITQHCLSPLMLRLRSRWRDACKEDEWEFVLAGIAPSREVTLLVDLRQFRHHGHTLSAQVRHTNNRLSCATKRDKGFLSHSGVPVAWQWFLHGQHIELHSVDLIVMSLKRHRFSTPGLLDDFPTFFE